MLGNANKQALNAQKNHAVNRYSLARLGAEVPKSKKIADLQWRMKFAKMKLSHWHGLENEQWSHLKQMHDKAENELKKLVCG